MEWEYAFVVNNLVFLSVNIYQNITHNTQLHLAEYDPSNVLHTFILLEHEYKIYGKCHIFNNYINKWMQM